MIYIVEDDKSIVRGLELFLQSAEMEFQSFGKAAEFLKEYAPGNEDILVLDLTLPDMQGSDLLQLLKAQGNEIPAIVVTALDDLSHRDTCKKLGVKAYLRKPVDGEALIDIIKYNQRNANI